MAIAALSAAAIRIGMEHPVMIVSFDVPTRPRSSARRWRVQIGGGWQL
jgi:hypothetical protein